jgi:hypothetical protein
MMKNEAKKKKKRCPNYSPEEKTLFLSIVHKNISTRVSQRIKKQTWLVRRKKVSVGRKLPRILTVKTREAYFAMQLRYTDFFLNCVQQQEKRL